MKHYPKIWLLRHGETEWNRAGQLQGWGDSPLTSEGQAQAAAQGMIIRPILAQGPDIFVSPLGRVQATARIVLDGAAFDTDPRLKEFKAGDWEGTLFRDIMVAHADPRREDLTFLDVCDNAPNGEGLAAFQARIISFLDDLTRPSVVIAHGLLGQVMRAYLCGIAVEGAGQLSNLQGVVYELDAGRERVLRA